MAYQISKYYRNILGLDLRVSDLNRNSGAATESVNTIYRQTGALSKRNGSHLKSGNDESGAAGLVKFNNVTIGTGVISEDLLSLDDSLKKYTQQTYTITYSGATSAYYDFYLDPDTATFKWDLYENGSLLFSQDCGTGKAVSDTTVAEIKTLVDAETGFTMTISTTPGVEKIAFSDLGRVVALDSGGVDSYYYTWVAVPSTGSYTTPFTTHWATRDASDFETASHAQMLDVLYIANGYDALHKYDGNRVYKAGLPQPTIPTDATTGAGSLGSGAGVEYRWMYTFEHSDAKQNILSSLQSEETTHTTAGANESRDITLTHLTAGSGYGVAEAIVNGTQAGVTTITVSSGHDLLIGDQVYIDDGVSGSIVKREVQSTTATTITIDGDAVDVTNLDPISQTKISLWRTKEDGTLFYLEQEFVNNTTTTTVTYTSTDADTSLVEEFIQSIKTPGLPPICRYIDVWRGQLVMTGNRESVNTVYYSDFDGENFPTDQSFVTESRLGGGNSGIKSLDNGLFIFKPRSILTVTGDLGVDNIQVDALADDGVGCVANATIKEIDGTLWFLGKQGIYTVNRQGHVQKSEQIDPKFNGTYSEKRAIAHYWIEKDLYLISLPFFSTDAGSKKYLDKTNSFIMVYDLYRTAWSEWNTLNMSGGVAEYQGNIYMTGFDQNPVDSTADTYFTKILDSGLEDDYADHNEGIAFSYKTHWEALGEPSIYKKFLRMKVHALDGTIGDFETDKFTLSVATEHDYVQAPESTFTLDFGGGSLGWGGSPWGQFVWGETRLEQLTSKLASKKAKALRTIFTNSNIHENVLISGYDLEISASYDLQIKD